MDVSNRPVRGWLKDLLLRIDAVIAYLLLEGWGFHRDRPDQSDRCPLSAAVDDVPQPSRGSSACAPARGRAYCLALLGATAALPDLAREDRLFTRYALAIAVGLVVVSLLRVLSFIPPLPQSTTTLDKAWRGLDLAMVSAIYLIPTLVCAGFVRWKLLPQHQGHRFRDDDPADRR